MGRTRVNIHAARSLPLRCRMEGMRALGYEEGRSVVYDFRNVADEKDVVEQGAPLSYSYDFAKVGRAAASRYVDPILKGTGPGDLPIEEVAEYELTVNRGVAKRFGLTTPDVVPLRAERVIERTRAEPGWQCRGPPRGADKRISVSIVIGIAYCKHVQYMSH